MTQSTASLQQKHETVLQPAIAGAMAHLLDLARSQMEAVSRGDIEEVERLNNRMRAALEHRASLMRSFLYSVRKPH
jgi:hypothetical protein